MNVAISQRIDVFSDRAEKRDALDQHLVRWVLEAGFRPFPIPNVMGSGLLDWIQSLKLDGIIFSGGNDIGTMPERDETERVLLDWASARSLPVLGICRGMQIMAVHSAGELVQVEGHVRARHRLRPDPASPGPWPIETNSFHSWALAGCPADFSVAARADDGTIEAMRHSRLPWEGWMWHPERETPFAMTDAARLRMLFSSIRI